MTETGSAGARREELRRNWEELGERVARAAAAAGRDRSELTVVAITKTWPASDVDHLREIGVHDVGENRAQELLSKLDALAGSKGPPLRWHFVGQLQRNKAAAIGRRADVVHTVDRAALIGPLQRAALQRGRPLDVFVQLSFDGDPERGGATADAIEELADAVAAADGLTLLGVMGVPPLGAEPRPAFAFLRGMSEQLRRSHPAAAAISAGMSGDLEFAVMEGATHLRVGTALMGSRA